MTYDEPKWFQKNSCLSTIFDHSDSYKNYPDKKKRVKKAFWWQPQAHASMHEF